MVRRCRPPASPRGARRRCRAGRSPRPGRAGRRGRTCGRAPRPASGSSSNGTATTTRRRATRSISASTAASRPRGRCSSRWTAKTVSADASRERDGQRVPRQGRDRRAQRPRRRASSRAVPGTRSTAVTRWPSAASRSERKPKQQPSSTTCGPTASAAARSCTGAMPAFVPPGSPAGGERGEGVAVEGRPAGVDVAHDRDERLLEARRGRGRPGATRSSAIQPARSLLSSSCRAGRGRRRRAAARAGASGVQERQRRRYGPDGRSAGAVTGRPAPSRAPPPRSPGPSGRAPPAPGCSTRRTRAGRSRPAPTSTAAPASARSSPGPGG